MASVWFEQVDKALIDEIKTSIKIRKRNGGFYRLDDQQVFVRKPEEDFKIETFPCVTIYNDRYTYDPIRYNEIPTAYKRDKESSLMTLEDTAVPFNLSYQLDFWARYQTDMNEMTQSWLLKHFRQFNLDVKDNNGVTRNCNVLQQQSMVKSDLMSEGNRIFHTIFNYMIWVELDEENRYNVPMVTKVSIDNETEV